MRDIHYGKNYLTEVIARVDFLSPIEGMQEKLPKEITAEAKRRFPIVEPQMMFSQHVEVRAPAELSTRQTQMKSWNFHGKNRDKTLTINPAAIFVEYIKYSAFEELKQDFSATLTALFETFHEAQPSRLGLRYINNIVLTYDNEDPLSWAGLINGNMLNTFRVAPDPKTLARVMSILEFNFGDFNLRYQFGMPNPDYPALIKQKFYVLDIDAYYQGLLEPNEVDIRLTKFHDRIQELFEQSITDKLRGIMNG